MKEQNFLPEKIPAAPVIQKDNALASLASKEKTDVEYTPYLKPFVAKLYVPTTESLEQFPLALDFRDPAKSLDRLHQMSRNSQEGAQMFTRVLQVLDAVYAKLGERERLKLAEAFRAQLANQSLSEEERKVLSEVLSKNAV